MKLNTYPRAIFYGMRLQLMALSTIQTTLTDKVCCQLFKPMEGLLIQAENGIPLLKRPASSYPYLASPYDLVKSIFVCILAPSNKR